MPRGGARKGAGRPIGVRGKTLWSREQIDRFRARIQTTKIIERLNGLIEGTVSAEAMPPHAVTAATALLNKVMPNLQASESVSEVTKNYVARLPNPVETTEEWQEQQTPPRLN